MWGERGVNVGGRRVRRRICDSSGSEEEFQLSPTRSTRTGVKSSSSDSDDDRVLSSVSKRVHGVRVDSKILKNLILNFMWGKSRSYLDQGKDITVLNTRMVTVRR